MAEIVNMPTSLTVLAERIRVAISRAKTVDENWIEASLELIVALCDARARFGSDKRFGMWIAEHEFDHIGRDERAALIHMGCDLDIARIVLEETKRRSYRLIWREEMEPVVRNPATVEPATAAPAVTEQRPVRNKQQTQALPATAPTSETTVRVIAALDALVKSLDGIDLAAFRRGLTLSQRRHVEALKGQVRNWFDVYEISK